MRLDSERVTGGDNVDWFIQFVAYVMKQKLNKRQERQETYLGHVIT
jgi:hypothetical protein